ncbi:MAG: RrF2 family transcriptional regulator [Bradymonadia bacterium]
MKLSNRCRYALLALFDIAFHNDGKPTQVRQIAERQNIPGRFLEQIFQDLRRAQLVDGKRGRNGGYFLHREPSQISFLDVILATETHTGLYQCPNCSAAEGGNTCPCESSCIPAQAWREVNEKIYEVYAAYNLNDLVQRAEDAGFSKTDLGYMYFI